MTSVTEEMIEAAADVLVQHGEFSSVPSRNHAHASVAARAALEAALSASPAAQTEDKLAKYEEALKIASNALLDAADKFNVIHHNHPGGVADGMLSSAQAEDKAFCAVMSDRMADASRRILAILAAPSAPQPTEPVAVGWESALHGALISRIMPETSSDMTFAEAQALGANLLGLIRTYAPSAALASPVAQQRDEGWFDISIAPKNGTRIVVQMPDGPGEEYWYETPAGWRYAALSPERKDQSNG